MNIAQTLARAVKADTGEQDADAALDGVRSAQRRVDDINGRRTALLQELADNEIKLGRTTDDAQAKKLVARIREIEDERLILAAQSKNATSELEKAKAALHLIGVSAHLKTAKRNTKALLSNTQEMLGHIDGYKRTYAKQFELMEKNALSLSVPVSGGMMLARDEFVQALRVELWRILPVHPLMRSSYPPLPGAISGVMAGDPSKERPLLDLVTEAMEFIVRKVEEGPVASPGSVNTPAAQPVTAEASEPSTDEDDAILALPADNAATMSAEQVMASLAPRKLA